MLRAVSHAPWRLVVLIFRISCDARPNGRHDPWAGRKVALASAIASPESFERSAREIGLTVLEHLRLRDHAVLGNAAMMQLMSRAAIAGAEAVVVTEKDAVKLDLPPDAPLRVVVLGVEPKLRKPDQLLSLVEACLRVGAP